MASEIVDQSTRGGVHLVSLPRPARLSRCRTDQVAWIRAQARSISSAEGLYAPRRPPDFVSLTFIAPPSHREDKTVETTLSAAERQLLERARRQTSIELFGVVANRLDLNYVNSLWFLCHY